MSRRVGPFRLVGSGSARPAAVRNAAWTCFGLAAVAGLGVVFLSGHWWLLAVGALCIAGAWYYTGGKRPYGYAGLGEIAVFVFFGLTAVLGTMYVQVDTISGSGTRHGGRRRESVGFARAQRREACAGTNCRAATTSRISAA